MQEIVKARGFYETGDWRQAESWYGRVLEADPNNAEALDRLGRMALQREDLTAAALYLQKAADLGSRDAALHSHLGVARARMKQYEEAIFAFAKAVELDPRSAEAHYNWGNALSALGRPQEAIEKFRAAAANMPDSPEIHYNLANSCRELGRLADAVAGYRQVLRLRHDHLKAYNNLGNVLREQGKLGEALETFHAALSINPSYVQAHHNLGLTLLNLQRTDEAIAQFREALRLDPNHLAARNSLGKALAEQGKVEEALPILQSARSQGKDNAETLLRMADRLRREGRLDEAIASIRAAIEARADFAAAHNDLGLVWFNKQDYRQAIESYRQAIHIKPDLAEAHSNLGIALFVTGEIEEGLKAVEAALRIKPDFAIAHLNRAVTWLRLGRFEEGWHEFEWRRQCDASRLPPLPASLWDGSPLPDRCLLLQSEQGLGDTLQFIRYAPLVKERCGSVILQCQPGLAPLLARCPGVDRVIVRGESLPEYHVQAPLMSLPGILGTTVNTIPAAGPYIFADDALMESWRQRLAEHAGFKVGIGWQGNPKYVADRLRSIPLRHFTPLAQLPGVRLFSLQKGPGCGQLAEVAADCPVVDFGLDFDSKNGTFMDTAAVVRNLDLVVTSDTAIAHLAGALGVPVWVALGDSCDWRWFDQRADSPWYPTMRLFRQATLGDWEELFGRIAAELQAVLSGETARLQATAISQAAPMRAPIAPGELLDKISILEIKRSRISHKEKLPNILRELAELQAVGDQSIPPTDELAELSGDLKAVNEALWQIEDEIRLSEARQDFGPRFIELARNVYRANDRRTAIKRRINQRLGSALVEEKEYPCYEAGSIVRSSGHAALRTDAPLPVFYLNLERRPDRKERFLIANEKIEGLEFRRWAAVDGQLLDKPELMRSKLIEAPLVHYTPGAMGNALSHKAIWDDCASRGERVLACEDDAVFNRHFTDKAASVLSQLPPDWDIVLWGWNFDSILEVELLPGLKRSVMHFDPAKLVEKTKEFQDKSYDVLPLRLIHAFGIVCYFLSPEGARALIRRCFPLKNETIDVSGLRRPLVNFSIDISMNKHYGSLKAYVALPPLVWTENEKAQSDVSR